MKKTFFSAKGILFLSIVVVLFLGVQFIKAPQKASVQKAEVIHTYLVKIPNCSGVCPYALMSMTHGRMQMLNNAGCVCPYSKNASYMTVRSKNVRSVRAMLPPSIQKEVQIQLADNTNEGEPSKIIQ